MKERKVQFAAVIAKTAVKSGKTEEIVFDLRSAGEAGVEANIKVLQAFGNGEALMVTLEPLQTTLNDERPDKIGKGKKPDAGLQTE